MVAPDPISEIDETSKLASFLLKLAWRLIYWTAMRVRLRVREVRERFWPVLREKEASDIAFEVLRGHILKALPFRNIGSKHRFLAVLRSENRRDLGCNVHLLEEFAGQYQEVFTSEPLYWANTVKELFSVQDMDRDGQKEIIFASSSHGTGAGMEVLIIYVPSRRKSYRMSVQRQWQEPAKPPTTVAVEPEPRDKVDRMWLSILERKVQSLSFLAPLEGLDLDDAKNAITRWHIENQYPNLGPFCPHYYEGEPPELGSVTARLTDGDIGWTAYFKGPVYGYVRSENKHFVVYSPLWIYHWPTCLAADTRFLWIGTRGDGIIRYDKQQNCLCRIKLEHGGAPLLDIESFRLMANSVEINRKVLFSKDVLTGY